MKKTFLILLLAVAVIFTAAAGIGISAWSQLTRDYYTDAESIMSEYGNGLDATLKTSSMTR